MGLEVFYKEDGVITSQRKFSLDLLREYEYIYYSSLSSPIDLTVELKAKEGAVLTDPSSCRTVIWKSNFFTNTRLDIAYSVQHLNQFIQNPREPHMKVANRLLRYLRGDPILGIVCLTVLVAPSGDIVTQTGSMSGR